jgi:hypothetical protein
MESASLAPTELLEAVKQQMSAMQEALVAAINQQNDKLDSLAQDNASLRQEIEAIKSGSAGATPRVTLTPPETEGQPSIVQKLVSGNGLKPANPETRPRTTPSERLPDPVVFKGRRKDLNTFLRQLRNKLRINADRYPSEDEKLSYAISRLGGDAANLVEPYDLHSVQALMDLLEVSYGDPNRQTTAQTKLLKLSQGSRPFPIYFAEFHRYAKETGWNDTALINHLLSSLHQELKTALLGRERPPTLEACANMINRLYNDSLLLGVQTRAPPQKPRTHAAARRDSDAMDLDTANHGYAPAGSAERQKRIKEHRCFKCGSKEHISPTCSAPIPRSDLRTSRSRPTSPVAPRSTSPRKSRRRHRSQGSRSPDSQASTTGSSSVKGRSRD